MNIQRSPHLVLAASVLLALQLLATAIRAQPLNFSPTVYQGGVGPRCVATADVNGDGSPDFITANSDWSLTVWTNTGSGSFVSNATYYFDRYTYCVATADISGKGRPDLVVGLLSNSLVVLTNDGHGLFVSNALYTVGNNPVSVAVSDLNGDGHPDLITANLGDGTLTLLTNDGAGGFGYNATIFTASAPVLVVAVDLNGDHHPDLISVSPGANILEVWTNNGQGRFFPAGSYKVGDATCVTAADLTGRGKPDLAVTFLPNGLLVLTNNGNAVFAPSATNNVAGNQGDPTCVLAANVSGGAGPDLVVANYSGNNSLIVFTNGGGGNFGSNATLNAGCGAYPYCVASADFNSDGRSDLVSARYYQSSAVSVLLNTNPFPRLLVISQQPANLVLDAGGGFKLSVTAAGPGPLTYQWQLNGVNLPNDLITTVAGGGYFGDGVPVTNTFFGNPASLAFDSAGNLFIADSFGPTVRKVGTNGIIHTVAGGGTNSYGGHSGYAGDGGPATNALLSSPSGIAVDAAGNLYIADYANHAIRKVSTSGIICTIAGGLTNNSGPYPGFSGDGGPATSAALAYPLGVALDQRGNLYIADTFNERVRKIDTNGIITTVVGGGFVLGDGGQATNAMLDFPVTVVLDKGGRIFISDYNNRRIRKVDTNGIISTIAGNGTYGSYDNLGDGGPATNAAFSYSMGLVPDTDGNLYFIDWSHDRVRKVDAAGIITSVAGNGDGGFAGDGGPATNASLWFYNNDHNSGLTLDQAGNLYIADTFNNRVREVLLAGLPTLTVTNAAAADMGAYRVVITGPSGSVTSAVAQVTVKLPPQNLSLLAHVGSLPSIRFSGTPGYGYVLLTATNLNPPVNWQPMATNYLDSSGTWSLSLTNPTGLPQGYYRVYGPLSP